MPSTDLDRVFAALADPTRRTIVERLARGPAVVGTVAQGLAVGPTAVSRHLRVLEDAGIITREVHHRHHVLRLRGDGLERPQQWIGDLREFWSQNIDRLVETVEGLPDTGDDVG
ncbi:MAG TPA: metalloregulator ArsR/SmtB family transcription factor [Acidimicrobiia bacterium]